MVIELSVSVTIFRVYKFSWRPRMESATFRLELRGFVKRGTVAAECFERPTATFENKHGLL